MTTCTCNNSTALCPRHDQAAKLPLAEKLSLVVYLTCLAIPKILYKATRSSIIAFWRGLPVKKYITCAFLGVPLGSLTPHHLQYVSKTSRHTYRSWMKGMRSKSTARGETATLPSLETEVKLLPDGESSILWIGNRKKAAKYVLFFHGGGYVVPLLPGHMEWCWRVFVAPYIGTQNEVAVAVLDYTLCPEAQHPTQLNQAIAALDYLISSGIRPDQILIGGDSAGGNLTAHLLSHLGHPDANVSPPLKLSQPLLGAFLVSPWMSQDVSQRSVTENTIDMLTAKNGRDASRNFYGDKYRHVNMLDNKSSAFDGMTSVVSNVYVTAGQQEALRDQAVLFVDILRRRNPSLEIRFEIAEKEAHDFILLEGEDKQTGDAMERMKAWASDLIH